MALLAVALCVVTGYFSKRPGPIDVRDVAALLVADLALWAWAMMVSGERKPVLLKAAHRTIRPLAFPPCPGCPVPLDCEAMGCMREQSAVRVGDNAYRSGKVISFHPGFDMSRFHSEAEKGTRLTRTFVVKGVNVVPAGASHVPPVATSIQSPSRNVKVKLPGRTRHEYGETSPRGTMRLIGPWGAIVTAVVLMLCGSAGCASLAAGKDATPVQRYIALEKDVQKAEEAASLAIDLQVWNPTPAESKAMLRVLDRLDVALDAARAKIVAGGDEFDAAVSAVRAVLVELTRYPAVTRGEKGGNHVAVDDVRRVGTDGSAGSGTPNRGSLGSGDYPD